MKFKAMGYVLQYFLNFVWRDVLVCSFQAAAENIKFIDYPLGQHIGAKWQTLYS